MSVALVTGSARGIGAALVREFSRCRYQTIATFRSCDTLEAFYLAPDRDPLIDLRRMDVTSDEEVQQLVDDVNRIYGRLDVLVNNAAIMPDRESLCLSDVNLKDMASAFETNVIGIARVTKAIMPLLLKTVRPRIVNLSSGAGVIATKRNPKYCAYSVSKAAANMLTRMIEVEFHKDVIVVAMTPGKVKTGMGIGDNLIEADDCAKAMVKSISGLTRFDCGKLLDRFGYPCFNATLLDDTGVVCPAGW